MVLSGLARSAAPRYSPIPFKLSRNPFSSDYERRGRLANRGIHAQAPAQAPAITKRAFLRNMALLTILQMGVSPSIEASEARVFSGKSGVFEFNLPVEGNWEALYDRKFNPKSPGALSFLNEGEKILICKWRQLDAISAEQLKTAVDNGNGREAALELAQILHGSNEEATASFAVEEATVRGGGMVQYVFTKSVCNGIVKPNRDVSGEVICTAQQGLLEVQRPLAKRRYVSTTILGEGNRVFALEASTREDLWAQEGNSLGSITDSFKLRPLK